MPDVIRLADAPVAIASAEPVAAAYMGQLVVRRCGTLADTDTLVIAE
jgi:hypothetical protein